MMSLFSVVQLYRFLESPRFDADTIHGEANYLLAKPYLDAVVASGFGRFEEIIVDGEDVDCNSLPDQGDKLSFEFKCVHETSENFHENLDDFLAADPRIVRGELPAEFFLVQENFYSKDMYKPDLIQSLYSLCEFIKCLSGLALYHDAKNGFKLVFVPTNSKGGSKSIVLETVLSRDLLLSVGALDCSLLRGLDDGAKTDPHYSEKIGVFGVTLTELYEKCSDNQKFFDYLVRNWSAFLVSYHNNLAVYLSGFAFHKAKKEVAQAEFDLASQFSKVIGDITAKLLGIPVSFAAVLIMLKSTDELEMISVLVSLLLFGVVMRGVLKNQYRHLERILHARDIVIGSFEGKRSDYPNDLSLAIDSMSSALKNDEIAILKQLRFLSLISWGPLVLAILLLCYRCFYFLTKTAENFFIWIVGFLDSFSMLQGYGLAFSI
ncbi:hypothetical protein CBP51_15165 [Cellvibrio mixtus]|uniref:Uncharacterized protein n=1 Tax=Cellvibrio mixtus TaxID=39650 RepID=A0A266Q3U4_9GAMM|nr:hypothetical protein [Cellvibrio mixtus]OZY84533.1 hypothetical protein CBP51_15165 [Cellvibrio mixtus]